MQRQRIISLIPSATEIVCALDAQGQLVGRSHECDYPLDVRRLPICSQPKYRSNGSSAEINKEVKTILREALSIYRINVERIRVLQPTHIITQSQCAVCAVSTDELREALHAFLHQDDVSIIDLSPESLEHVFQNITAVADALFAFTTVVKSYCAR